MMFKKVLLGSLLMVVASASMHASAEPMPAESPIEQYTPAPKCYVNGQFVRIQNAAGTMLEVYNVTGVRVLMFRVDSEDKTFNLSLPKGIYLLKAGKFVRKIYIN